MTGELTVRRKTGVVRPSLLLLHLVSDEDPFARALCGTRPRSKRGEGWSAPLDDPPNLQGVRREAVAFTKPPDAIVVLMGPWH